MMSEKKKQFDFNSPEVQALIDEIVHGTFVKQGTMVAFPTCFPGTTIPIVPDESHITALDVTPEGIVYGGTTGKRSHIFVAMFHGVTGMVFDMKAVEGATHCPAVCCGKTKLLACVNGPRGGGRILMTKLQPLPFDLIQEWGFERPAVDDLGECVAGEAIVHAVADTSGDRVVGVTAHHLFTVDMETSKIQVVGEVSGSGRLAVGSEGSILGSDGAGHVWRYDTGTQTLDREACKLPDGIWHKGPLLWSRAGRKGLLYTADNDGQMFSFDERRGFSASLGKRLSAPVGPMAVTFDGRVFGFCGAGIAKMFCYEPGRGENTDLGVAVSVFERRRYGYVFGDAVTGRDGEIIFAEDDDAGHLWLYFPRIQAARTSNEA
jgi:hypothetical protein